MTYQELKDILSAMHEDQLKSEVELFMHGEADHWGIQEVRFNLDPENKPYPGARLGYPFIFIEEI